MEWKEVRLGDIVTIRSGLAYKGSYLGKGENILLGMGCVSFKEKFLNSGARPYDADAKEQYCVRSGDIVLATRQQSDNLPILAMPAIVPDNLNAKQIIFGTNLYKIENHSDIDNKYLFWQLKTPHYVDYISSVKTGSVVRMVTKKNVEDYVFKCPTKDIRDKISNLLWSLDRKIELNNKINAQLEEMAQTLFKHWFVDFGPFKDGKFVESELGMIPEGWRVGTLREICCTNKRSIKGSIKQKIKYLDTGSITDNIIEGYMLLDPKEDKIPSRARKLVQEGDIVFSTVRPNQRHFGLLYNPDSNIVVSTGFCVLTANWSGYRYYLYQVLKQSSALEYFQALAEQTVSTYPSISASDIEEYKIVIPPIDVAKEAVSSMASFYARMDVIQKENLHLAQLRDTLLPKLMSGEIEL